MAGIGPEDVDVVQLQDTDAGSEVIHMAENGFCEHGEQEQDVAVVKCKAALATPKLAEVVDLFGVGGALTLAAAPLAAAAQGVEHGRWCRCVFRFEIA